MKRKFGWKLHPFTTSNSISEQDTPLLAALARQTAQGRLSFHMPGHRNGQSIPQSLREVLLSLDTTELPITDDLHQPSGPALLAMQAAAMFFGAGQTFFLTQGTTGGLLALLSGLVGRGESVILPRTCHLSVHHAISLLDLEANWIDLEPQTDPWGFLPEITALQIQTAIQKAPHSKAVLLTYPDYYGRCADLTAIAKIAHAAGMMLLIDEAHGAHLAARPDLLPLSALKSGADACVQSAHKTLPALTQGAYLHLSTTLIVQNPAAIDRVRTAIKVFMTSSPSFIIAASLDYARAFLEKNGQVLVEQLLAKIEHFRTRTDSSWEISPATCGLADQSCRDPLRLIIRDRLQRQSAIFWTQALSEKGIDVEMADLSRLVLILALDTPDQDFLQLSDALNQLASEFERLDEPRPDKNALGQLELNWQRLLIAPATEIRKSGDVLFGSQMTERVALINALDRVAAVPVSPYPPGIPLILPGEEIDRSRLDLLLGLQENKITLSGVENGYVRVLV